MFKLTIESDNDISEIQINYSNGTKQIATVESPSNNAQNIKQTPEVAQNSVQSSNSDYRNSHFEQPLDLDVDYDHINQEVIELPQIEIDESTRGISVAEELQNLDI